MKKQLWIMALCVVLIGSITACGSKESASPESGSSSEKTKISYWTGDRHDSEYIKELVDEFNKTNPDNIEVELVIKGDDFDQALDMSFQTSEAPDVIRVKENTIQTFYKKGFLAPIDEFMTDELKEKFPIMDNLNSFDGKRYSLPNYGTTMRLIYNKELFEKAGIASPPTTLDELVADAKKITAVGKASGAYGFAQNFKSPASALGRSARVIACGQLGIGLE